jgi:hypothetical protein
MNEVYEQTKATSYNFHILENGPAFSLGIILIFEMDIVFASVGLESIVLLFGVCF